MRLPCLFAAFFIGLLAATPSAHPTPPWPELAGIVASLSIAVVARRSPVTCLSGALFAAFFLGALWITRLPTWQNPLEVQGLPADSGCTVVGRAVGEAFESPAGRLFPVSVEAARAEGHSPEGGAFRGPWLSQQGAVLVQVGRGFVGVPGARYRAHGCLVTDSSSLHAPIALRYRPIAILGPSMNGGEPVLIGHPAPLADAINRLRYRLMSHLSWGLRQAEGELVAGITFGRRGRRLEGSWTGDFYSAGLSHLIVASGAQVSLLFLPVFFLLGRIRLPSAARWLLLLGLALALIGFARLLGGEPSILRAAAMGCILLLSLGLGRRAYGLATLAAAGWFWLIQNPLLARDTGFLLSFGASFGILYLGPPLFDSWAPPPDAPARPASSVRLRTFAGVVILRLRGVLRFMVTCTLFTFAAQIGVMPALACTVGRISPVGFLANLFAVPLGQLVLFLGALSGLGGFICPALSLLVNSALKHLAVVLMIVAHDFAHLPYANTPVPPLPAWVALACYAVCVLLVERRRAHYRPAPTIERRGKRRVVSPAEPFDVDGPLPRQPD